MTKGITVNQLAQLCKLYIDKGCGDKQVLISSDDEGNEYHTLYYSFNDDIEMICDCKRYGMLHDDNDVNDVILLG